MSMVPRKTLEVKRFAAGSYVKGDYVEGADNTFNITASVQPLRGKEMELLPEARREFQAYKLYSDTQLLTVNTSETKNPDQVKIDGVWHEVLIVQDWQNIIINHYKIIVSRMSGNT